MKVKSLIVSTIVLLLFAAPAMAAPQPPPPCKVEAKTGGNQTVNESILVTLNGAPSSPQSKDNPIFSWSQDPNDSFQVTLSSTSSDKPTFTAPYVGPNGATLHFTLTVTAACNPGTSSSTTVNVTVENVNRAPIATASAIPGTVNEGGQFTLDGSGSTDADGDTLTFSWSQVLPDNSLYFLTDAATVTYTAPAEVPYPDGATLKFRLTVRDGAIEASADTTVTVKWVNDPPVAQVSCTTPVNEGDLVALDGSSSTDNDGILDIASYEWRQLSGGPDSGLTSAELLNKIISLNAPSLSSPFDTMTFELKVTDKGSLYSLATCSVQVLDVTPPVITVPEDEDTIAEATSPSGAMVSFTVTANDAHDGPVDVTCNPASGVLFDFGPTTVSCSAQDGEGNSAQKSFIVTVVDTIAPTIECSVPAQAIWYGADVTVNCTASDGGSGLSNSSDESFALSTNVTANTETDNASTDSRQVCDNVGNCATAGPYTFKVDKKAPTVTCGSADGAWHAADVSIKCAANDDGSALKNSGDASFNLTTSVPAGTETADAATDSREVCDTVGNCATAGPISGNKVDKKAPSITASATKADGTAYTAGTWTNQSVTVQFTCSDEGSGVKSCGSDVTLTSDGETADVPGTAIDNVGNSAGTTFGPVKIDKTAPTVFCGSSDGLWHANDISIGCTASDGGSGLKNAGGDASFNLTTSVSAGTETDDASTNSRNVCDSAGNCATAGPISGNKVDKKAPTTISFIGSIGNNASYYFGFVPAAPTCSATDGGSGLKSCVVTGYGTAVGTHTLTATATDNVGNTSTSSLTYTVMAWTLKGFYQPVDMNGVWNTVKNGSTVPLKFEVFAGSTELTDVSVVKSVTSALVACGAGTEDAIEQVVTTTGGTVLRYDTTGGQFIDNWKTPATATKCYRVTMTTQDGSSLIAFFKLK